MVGYKVTGMERDFWAKGMVGTAVLVRRCVIISAGDWVVLRRSAEKFLKASIIKSLMNIGCERMFRINANDYE